MLSSNETFLNVENNTWLWCYKFHFQSMLAIKIYRHKQNCHLHVNTPIRKCQLLKRVRAIRYTADIYIRNVRMLALRASKYVSDIVPYRHRTGVAKCSTIDADRFSTLPRRDSFSSHIVPRKVARVPNSFWEGTFRREEERERKREKEMAGMAQIVVYNRIGIGIRFVAFWFSAGSWKSDRNFSAFRLSSQATSLRVFFFHKLRQIASLKKTFY